MKIQLDNLTINTSVKSLKSDNKVQSVEVPCKHVQEQDESLSLREIEVIVRQVLERINEY